MTIGLRDVYGVSQIGVLGGGAAGQALVKKSAADGDFDWANIDSGIIPDPAAGVEQSITAASPGDTPLELTPATGQTEALLKANGFGIISENGLLLGRTADTDPAPGEIGEYLPGNTVFSVTGGVNETLKIPAGVWLVHFLSHATTPNKGEWLQFSIYIKGGTRDSIDSEAYGRAIDSNNLGGASASISVVVVSLTGKIVTFSTQGNSPGDIFGSGISYYIRYWARRIG